MCKRNKITKAFQDMLSKGNNPPGDRNSESASSDHPTVDYFPKTADSILVYDLINRSSDSSANIVINQACIKPVF